MAVQYVRIQKESVNYGQGMTATSIVSLCTCGNNVGLAVLPASLLLIIVITTLKWALLVRGLLYI